MAPTPAKAAVEMTVSVYGDVGNLFRLTEGSSNSGSTTPSGSGYSSLETWSKPLSVSQRNIRLEDVFHAVSSPDMGCPVTHSAHILHGRLNYVMSYHDAYVDQTHAFMIRDETVSVLRMATEVMQQ